MKVLHKSHTKLSLFPLFAASVVAMLFFLCIGGKDFLYRTDVLDKSMLSSMAYQQENCNPLFGYVLRERFWIVPIIFLLSTTYLTTMVVYGVTIWYGAGLGTVLGVAMLRYGIRGVVLVLAAGFPQYVLYIPVMIMTLRLSMEQRVPCKKFFTQLFILEMVVIIGCFFESYVNLMLLEKIIHIFIGG